ncbi:MAG TPA: hypothetical protein VLJ68_06375 [Chitinophagaceae bacterium]|nr:hypothetical protein [Chitinophagaceae bacterium]
MHISSRTFAFLLLISTALSSRAQVKYDEGAAFIKGVTLLQDRANPKDYYYLPKYPRLAVNDKGELEFLCIKYTGDKAENSGGLFHALVDFKIPDSLFDDILKELRKVTPGARIAGPVPLMQPKKEDPEITMPSFDIVSGILSNKEGPGAMTRSVVTSGFAPLTPGSKAAVAALLSPQGATLLWNSFTGPTSDVSISIHGYYEAAVKAYNATVTAEMSVVYTHFSQIMNNQEGYSKNQIRNITDQMIKEGGIKVDVFDRSAGLGIKTNDMDGILSLVTNKLTEIMFDTKTGWSKEPERADPNLGFVDQLKQEKTGVVSDIADGLSDVMGSLPILGWFAPKRYKNLNPQYRTDNQYILKDIKDIRSNKFYLNLSKSTTIKVPFHTAGNLGGLYSTLGTDPRYFRIVNMDDPAFQNREINFQVDGEFTDAFDDIINFVTVNFRKKYGNGQDDVTNQLIINGTDLKKGVNLKTIGYPRLGIQSSDWLNYEYQLLWSFKGKTKAVRYPADETQWIKSGDPGVSLVPPLVKEYIEIDGDRPQFITDEIASVDINFLSVQGGDKKVVKHVVLRAGDANSTTKINVYHDKNSPVVYQAKWYSKTKGVATAELAILNSNYLFLSTPAPELFKKP